MKATSLLVNIQYADVYEQKASSFTRSSVRMKSFNSHSAKRSWTRYSSLNCFIGRALWKTSCVVAQLHISEKKNFFFNLVLLLLVATPHGWQDLSCLIRDSTWVMAVTKPSRNSPTSAKLTGRTKSLSLPLWHISDVKHLDFFPKLEKKKEETEFQLWDVCVCVSCSVVFNALQPHGL